MLEVKNLVKCYSTKGGVTVRALDDVSVQFPETGMVFLLGRSGSGKSTLLNVSGGLDKPDSGEIIVKGRSSKDFSAADFDSYRNTYVGFVFQEYNILNEFTVEQNIALALQLQNKPNDKKAVEELLAKVDLEGLGKRKPNTLSGGQKQRVAIARALIKEPEIIMADEPTGALDSNTGKQVLDTLKKLSQTKLVVIVSHDREFAEQYGDRIIELKDGQIISDVSKTFSAPKNLNENVQIISEDTISIKNAESITESDVKNIVAMLKKNGGEAIISAGKKDIKDVKRACKINDSGSKEYFKDTDKVDIKEYDGKQTKFIKSRLPGSHAFKMGASGLRTKPIRLIFTILLSVVAFLMFGIVSTFMLYDSNYSVSEAMREADYPSITVQKYYSYISQNIERDNSTGVETIEHESEQTAITRFGVQEIKDKNALGQGDFAGIFDFTNSTWEQSQTIEPMIAKKDGSSITVNIESKSQNYYPVTSIYGFTDCGEEYMTRNQFTLVEGKYPTSAKEIAIPEYVANLFVNSQDSSITMNSIVGKEMKFSGCNAIPSSQTFKIVGVYKVGEIPAKYDDLKEANANTMSSTDKKELTDSLEDFLANSFHTIIYVHEDFYALYEDNIQSYGRYVESRYANGVQLNIYNEITEDYQDWWSTNFYTENTFKNYSNQFKLYDIEGQQVTSLDNMAEDEIYLPIRTIEREYKDSLISYVNSYGFDLKDNLRQYDMVANEELGENSDFANGLMDVYSENADLDYLVGVIEKWYPTLKEREFYYNKASDLIHTSKYGNDSDLAKAYVTVDGYLNNQTTETQITAKELSDAFAEMKRAFGADYKTEYKRAYYFIFAEEMLMYYRSDDALRNELDLAVVDLNYDSFDTVVSNIYALSDPDFEQFSQLIDDKYTAITGKTFDDLTKFETAIPEANIDFKYVYYKDYTGSSGKLKVIGFFDDGQDYGTEYLVKDAFISEHSQKNKGEQDLYWFNREKTDYVAPEDAKYNFIITLTDNTQEQISAALSSEGSVKYKLTNAVYKELDMFLEMITEMEQIFLIVGIVLGVFAALMLLNFISVSINAKKKDIGILRAVGARGSDVFKIFFAEAFIIAVICFVLATVGAYVVCNVINTSMVTMVKMKLLDFQLINVGLILAVSFGISIIATFFPVYIAAKKSPVESIRAL